MEFTSSQQLVQLQFKNYICTQWLKFPIRRTAQMFDGILVADKLHPFQYYEAPKVIDPLSDLHKEKKQKKNTRDMFKTRLQNLLTSTLQNPEEGCCIIRAFVNNMRMKVTFHLLITWDERVSYKFTNATSTPQTHSCLKIKANSRNLSFISSLPWKSSRKNPLYSATIITIIYTVLTTFN